MINTSIQRIRGNHEYMEQIRGNHEYLEQIHATTSIQRIRGYHESREECKLAFSSYLLSQSRI
jgi:hypothetical protein